MASKTPTGSPTRRVLGDLTPKAINTPSKYTHAVSPADALRSARPLKRVQTMSPGLMMKNENTIASPFLKAGRKRSICEVEGIENQENARRGFGARDEAFWAPGLPVTTSALREHEVRCVSRTTRRGGC